MQKTKNFGIYSMGSTIRISQENQCLPYTEFLVSGVKFLIGFDIDTWLTIILY